MYAVIINTIIYDDYSTFFKVPYAIIISLLQLSIFLQFVCLSTCKMPNLLQRIAIAWPSAVLFSAMLLTLLLVILFPLITWVPYLSILFIIPILLSIFGLYQTTYTPSSIENWDYIKLQAPGTSNASEKVTRSKNLTKSKFSLLSNNKKPENSIRIVQITGNLFILLFFSIS